MDTFLDEETYVVALNPGFGAASNQIGRNVNRDVPSADGLDHMGVVLQRIIGMYGLGLTVEAPLPFASTVPVGEGQNGRQPGVYGFSSYPVTPAPLKRYGNYPPKAAAEVKKLAILSRTAEALLDDQAELETQSTGDVNERGEGEGWEEGGGGARAREISEPFCLSRQRSLKRIDLEYSTDICSMPEGEDEVVMVFEMSDRRLEASSEEGLTCVNHDLDHATTKVTFRPSMAEVEAAVAVAMMAVAKRGLAWSVVSTLTVLAEGAATLRLRCDVEWWNTEPDTASATVDGGGGGGGGAATINGGSSRVGGRGGGGGGGGGGRNWTRLERGLVSAPFCGAMVGEGPRQGPR
eukprot:jgi/Undpi1/12369/HiC_scaffold_5.g02041.m1